MSQYFKTFVALVCCTVVAASPILGGVALGRDELLVGGQKLQHLNSVAVSESPSKASAANLTPKADNDRWPFNYQELPQVLNPRKLNVLVREPCRLFKAAAGLIKEMGPGIFAIKFGNIGRSNGPFFAKQVKELFDKLEAVESLDSLCWENHSK